MRTFATFAIALLALSTAQAAPAPEPPDTPQKHEKIMVNKVEREYILHTPTGFDGSNAMPLVLAFHGHGMEAEQLQKSMGIDEIADREGFFVAYLVGKGDGLAWNNGLTDVDNVDDVAFARKLAKQMVREKKVDATRIYAAGFSNGAMMTHRLAAELPDVLAAVALAEGTVGLSWDEGKTWQTTPTPTGPIPIMIMHGKADPALKYEGGDGGLLFAKSVDDAKKFWKQANGCTGKPSKKTGSNGNITETWSNCTSPSEIVLVTLVKGEHQWPTKNNPANYKGSEQAWKFFAKHSLKKLTAEKLGDESRTTVEKTITPPPKDSVSPTRTKKAQQRRRRRP